MCLYAGLCGRRGEKKEKKITEYNRLPASTRYITKQDAPSRSNLSVTCHIYFTLRCHVIIIIQQGHSNSFLLAPSTLLKKNVSVLDAV